MNTYAYKVTQSAMPAYPVGQLLLVDEWHGKRHTWKRYNSETLCFEPQFTARYLGRVTARSEKARIRQLLSLPGNARALKRAQAQGFR